MTDSPIDHPGLLIVVPSPSKEIFDKKKHPLSGAYGKMLSNLTGVEQQTFIESHEGICLIERWPGAHPIKGDKFPMTEALRHAKAMIPKMSNRVVLFVGDNVAKAFGMKSYTYLQEYTPTVSDKSSDPARAIIVVPSSIDSNWYKNPTNMLLAGKVLLLLHYKFRKK